MPLYTRTMDRRPELLPVSLDPDPTIEAYKKDVDRTILRENLRLTTAGRVEKMIAALRIGNPIKSAPRRRRHVRRSVLRS